MVLNDGQEIYFARDDMVCNYGVFNAMFCTITDAPGAYVYAPDNANASPGMAAATWTFSSY
jgi:hypothetical protein